MKTKQEYRRAAKAFVKTLSILVGQGKVDPAVRARVIIEGSSRVVDFHPQTSQGTPGGRWVAAWLWVPDTETKEST